jgi:ABC-type sugar transport system permease subunit
MSARTALVVRIGLIVLAVSGALIGVWAGFAPRSFYDDFPGLGRHWVSVDGPYNEHLVRDVGWLNLALTVITVWAAVSLARSLVLAVLVGWLVVDIPHLVYHAANLDGLSGSDGTAEIISLALGPAIAAALLVLVARGDAAEAG